MTARRVVIGIRARADIREKSLWLRAERSAGVADRWQLKLDTATDSLRESPERCPPAEEAPELGTPVRQLLFQHGRGVYRLVFSIEGETVVIHRVRHAAQDRLTDADV